MATRQFQTVLHICWFKVEVAPVESTHSNMLYCAFCLWVIMKLSYRTDPPTVTLGIWISLSCHWKDGFPLVAPCHVSDKDARYKQIWVVRCVGDYERAVTLKSCFPFRCLQWFQLHNCNWPDEVNLFIVFTYRAKIREVSLKQTRYSNDCRIIFCLARQPSHDPLTLIWWHFGGAWPWGWTTNSTSSSYNNYMFTHHALTI